MKLRFVGGFLGSGKTTAIAGACGALRDSGSRVGVVTNDQGKLQVDALFLRSLGAPVVEVSGGCFCCRYEDFDAAVSSLAERERPDIVFAESVGSCADLIATVVRPFEAFRASYGADSVLSVFADSRLLLARLEGRRLPFGEGVLYLFDKQLEEADLIVLNKRDLLSEAERNALRDAVSAVYPGVASIAVSARDAAGAEAWLGAVGELEGGRALRAGALDMDYELYGAGESELAWLDERLSIEDRGGLGSDGSRCRAAVLAFALALTRGLSEATLAAGHLKLLVSAPGYERKLSLTAADLMNTGSTGLEASIADQLPPFSARRATVSLNARVQGSAGALAAIAGAAAEAARRAAGVTIAEEDRSAFSPGFPRPTHRIVSEKME